MDDKQDDIELTSKERRIDNKNKRNEKWERFGFWMGSGGKASFDEDKARRKARAQYRAEPTKKEYVYFGSFPQTIKSSDVEIERSLGEGLYLGSDGETYCKREYNPRSKTYGSNKFDYAFYKNNNVNAISRYSDGQNDSNTEYFKVEPIKWRVIKREDGILTLLADKVLFNSIYHKYGLLSVGFGKDSWVKSDIRTKLNNDFFNTAFSYDERDGITYSTVEIDKHNLFLLNKTLTASATSDKVFILGANEREKYGLKVGDLAKTQTDFCGKGFGYEFDTLIEHCVPWMTRSVYGTTESYLDNKFYVKPQVINEKGCYEDNIRIEPYNNRPVISPVELGVVPVISVLESAVTVYGKTDASSDRSASSSDADDYSGVIETDGAADEPKPPPPPRLPTKKDRIKYSIVAPACMVLGAFIALIVKGIITNDGGMSGSIPSILMIAYMTFSEVMIWKIEKNLSLIKTLAILNTAVSFICWITMGW